MAAILSRPQRVTSACFVYPSHGSVESTIMADAKASLNMGTSQCRPHWCVVCTEYLMVTTKVHMHYVHHARTSVESI